MLAWCWRHKGLTAALLACGALLGSVIVWAPGLAVMLGLCVGLGGAVNRYAPPEDRRFLISLYASAIGVRFLVGASLHLWAMYHGTGYLMYGQESFDVFGDSAYVSLRGWIMALVWKGQIDRGTIDQGIFNNAAATLVYPYAWFHYLFGFSQFAVKLINSVFGVLTACVSYAIVKALCGRVSGKIAAVLVAFFPSTLLWSVTNLKEIPTALGLLWACWAAILLLQRGVRLSSLIQLGLALGLLWVVRPLVAVVTGLCLCGGLLWGWLWGRWGRVVTVGAVLCVIGLAVGLPHRAGVPARQFWEGKAAGQFMALISSQVGQTTSAGSAYRIYETHMYENSDASTWQITPRTTLHALAKGLVYFLLTPVPWRVASLSQGATIPEMLLWYALLAFGVWGAAVLVRAHPETSPTLLLVAAALTALMALSAGNIGTAFRHRGIVIPLYLILSAAGLGHVWGGLQRRDAAAVRVV